MKIASFLGALGLAASVFFLFYQFWGKFSTPRYMVNLAYGAKFEPWIVSVQPLDVNLE